MGWFSCALHGFQQNSPISFSCWIAFYSGGGEVPAHLNFHLTYLFSNSARDTSNRVQKGFTMNFCETIYQLCGLKVPYKDQNTMSS